MYVSEKCMYPKNGSSESQLAGELEIGQLENRSRQISRQWKVGKDPDMSMHVGARINRYSCLGAGQLDKTRPPLGRTTFLFSLSFFFVRNTYLCLLFLLNNGGYFRIALRPMIFEGFLVLKKNNLIQ